MPEPLYTEPSGRAASGRLPRAQRTSGNSSPHCLVWGREAPIRSGNTFHWRRKTRRRLPDCQPTFTGWCQAVRRKNAPGPFRSNALLGLLRPSNQRPEISGRRHRRQERYTGFVQHNESTSEQTAYSHRSDNRCRTEYDRGRLAAEPHRNSPSRWLYAMVQ